MTGRSVVVYPDRQALARDVAERVAETIGRAVAERGRADIVLTGGGVGIAVLRALRGAAVPVDWPRVRLWWGDERWLPAGDAERNDTQAAQALLDHVALDPSNVHRFPVDDGVLGLDAAADAYAKDLASGGGCLPDFDLVLLGVGPDGHVASLFPGLPGVAETRRTVVAVRDSPKPPPERLSLTRPAIDSARRVWLVAAGAEKAAALARALGTAPAAADCPAAAVEGRRQTVFFLDDAAAAELPRTAEG